jgi:GntR family transcriptional regulator
VPRIADYHRIAAGIRALVTSGELRPSHQLPSIRQLQRQYGVSATPVKTALLVLQTEGHTEGRQGRGVFVADR